MTKPSIHRWIHKIDLSDVVSPDYDANLRQGKPNADHCLLCGKRLTGKFVLVHLLTSGDLVSSDENFADSQGFHKVGLNCADKLPNSFTFKP